MNTGKKYNLPAVILIIVIALATSFIMISCGAEGAYQSKSGADQAAEENTIIETNEEGETIVYKVDENGETKVIKSTEKSSNKADKTTGKNEEKQTTKSTTKATEAAKVCYISIDGYCSGKSITLQGGDTVYSILKRSGATVSGSGSYIKGINGRFEFDEGPQSGWMYSVNGYTPNVSCGSYGIGEGDSISWYYVTSY